MDQQKSKRIVISEEHNASSPSSNVKYDKNYNKYNQDVNSGEGRPRNSGEEKISGEEKTSGEEDRSSDNYDNSPFIIACEALLDKITVQYRQQREEIRDLIKLHRKELKSYKKHKKNKLLKDKSGFTKETPVPDGLAQFLKLEKGTLMSRPQVTALLCEEFKRRGLYYTEDKRVIRPDADVKKLFNLQDNVDSSINARDNNGLNFFNLQKYIAKCYNDYNGDIKTA